MDHKGNIECTQLDEPIREIILVAINNIDKFIRDFNDNVLITVDIHMKFLNSLAQVYSLIIAFLALSIALFSRIELSIFSVSIGQVFLIVVMLYSLYGLSKVNKQFTQVRKKVTSTIRNTSYTKFKVLEKLVRDTEKVINQYKGISLCFSDKYLVMMAKLYINAYNELKYKIRNE